MNQALYRKYRSKSLDELVGQDHIVNALSASIKSAKISHAYLFTGPRGTGKTSVARILAHDLNGIKYDESKTYIDIIEIDAASNRRIDEIRDLREKVQIAPTSLKYKVYIIDEVHMLTKEAFNALLKTLEEPPQHAIFILATTELHKVPDTIISRTQRYAFKPIEQEKIIGHLKTIAEAENIDCDEEALGLIAEHAEGGFRDAIGLLDQVRHTTNKITSESVMDALGIPPVQLIEALWQNMTTKAPQAAGDLKRLYEAGYHAPQIAKSLLQRAVASSNVSLAKELLSVSSSYDPKTELLLITLQDIQPKVDIQELKPTEQLIKITPDKVTHETTPKLAKKEIQAEVSENIHQKSKSGNESHVVSTDKWQEILEVIKSEGHSVYGPLRLAEATLSETELKLGLAFPFHIKRINDQKNLDIIHKVIKNITGKSLQITVERINRDDGKTAPASAAPNNHQAPEIATLEDPDIALMTDPLSIVKNVFGGAEVL